MRIIRLRLRADENPFARSPDSTRYSQSSSLAKAKRSRANSNRRGIFYVFHANQLGSKLAVRYQTDNALRTVAAISVRTGATNLALREFASGRRWTFAQLFAAGEARRRPLAGSSLSSPAGPSPEFILDILAAWRENKMVCPLEPGQNAARFSPARQLRSSQIHLGHRRHAATGCLHRRTTRRRRRPISSPPWACARTGRISA